MTTSAGGLYRWTEYGDPSCSVIVARVQYDLVGDCLDPPERVQLHACGRALLTADEAQDLGAALMRLGAEIGARPTDQR